MNKKAINELRQDCLTSVSAQLTVLRRLAGQHILITGGTGFLGSWLAETVAALNDEYGLNIRLELLARGADSWARRFPHLATRADIVVRSQDVRGPFEIAADVKYVIHAAGVPDGREHASDPLRVLQTIVTGTMNTLDAASKSTGLERLLHVSSGLVYGGRAAPAGFDEESFDGFDAGQVGAVYAEAKREAENICAVYRSQFRLPIVTVRPFTFVGPYQDLNRPWALNNFLRDAISGRDIKIHGDGETRRSFLYGSDAACWALCALLGGTAGRAYNLGSQHAVSLRDVAMRITAMFSRRISVQYRTMPAQQSRAADFVPNTTRAVTDLRVRETVDLDAALRKTVAWNESVKSDQPVTS